ncbi:phage shock protein B [Sphingomonas palmae]|uniref:Phage shock protein B n=1 Tax=Sphingomonas palmae TaxID=1855283 RepID=A0A1H7ICT5_9SPHN|nr:envelope stress response membrane protein PspB [Sphingomonas palmae]SEK59547.1 phage shock protein B [Sphingomonas palmae]
MEDILTPVFVCAILFIGLPWLIFHYVTKWKTAPRITDEDERLLDEMYNLARRLEERVNTVERIVAADNPDFRPGLADYRNQPDYRLEGGDARFDTSRQQRPSFERRN